MLLLLHSLSVEVPGLFNVLLTCDDLVSQVQRQVIRPFIVAACCHFPARPFHNDTVIEFKYLPDEQAVLMILLRIFD